MLGLYWVNGEMWQKRCPDSAYGQHFQDQWRRLIPYEDWFKARITYADQRSGDES
jgi:hypothetical protein